MQSIAAKLQKTELFAAVPEEQLQALAALGRVQEYARGQFLIVPQQRVDTIGVVLSGKLRLLHLFPDGDDCLMSNIWPGQLLGADLICTRTRLAPYHVDAAAPSQLLYLPGELLTCPGTLPEPVRLDCLNRLLTLISHDNMRKEYRLAILARKSLRERIWVYLTMQADRRQSASFTIPFSRDEMASFLCVNRSALSHELSLMRQEGLIEFSKNRFTLPGWTPAPVAER